MKTLSIITINRNNADGLDSTLLSIAGQTWRDFELIVIDGASTDQSSTVMEKHRALISRSLSEPDQGIYDAQNKGIGFATGDFLLFLNSGDRLQSLETLAQVMPLLSGDICYGDMVLQKNGVEVPCKAPHHLTLDHMINSTLWHPSTFIRRTLFLHHGLYNTSFKLAGDYEFFVRCFLKPGITFRHLSQTIAIFDGSGRSNDPDNAALLKKERDLSWSLNLSDQVSGALKMYNWFARSRYLNIIMFLEKIRGGKKA